MFIPQTSTALTYIVGISIASLVTLLSLRHQRIADDQPRLTIVVAVLGIVAGVGAKLYSILSRGSVAWQNPGWELSSGYRYPGAMLAVLVFAPVVWRLLRPGVPILRFLDSGGLGVCAGMIVIRIGCFVAGCCHGMLTDVAWATRYPADTSPWHAHLRAGLISRSADWSEYGHPLQIYFLIALVTIGIFLLWLRKRQTYDGQLLLWFMVLNGLSKGILESLRFSYVASLQIYSVTMAAIAALLLAVIAIRAPRGSPTPASQ